MKTKKLLGAAACFAAMILASCGDGTTGNGNNDSLFGRIPSIYEKKQVEIIEILRCLGRYVHGVCQSWE